MRVETMRHGKTLLYGALLAGIAYSTLALYSEPAYAATCTQASCEQAFLQAANICSSVWGTYIDAFECPATSSCSEADNYFFRCAEVPHPGTCSPCP